ncbi:hypothetical protein G7066_13165 [Leucobacter coleopterorum]|uniref:4-amino-4-deoxy-L-arabinose transferase n=1 Tax=Leucobacter coleopterorum TaxID=2714933 RepID=A0ABX6JYH5_9MICO|nr:DUF6541 family protein [Leucobacter coleopterorum]QIM19278.1 hypothetical protein G7066_13165 [Leucobacter coleopterorum]
MSWIEAIPTALASAAILLIPGLAVGWFIGLRRLWLLALAPAVSITLLSVASVALPLIGISWHPLSALLFAAIFGALIVCLFRFALRARFDFATSESGRSWPTIVAWAFCSIALITITAVSIGKPENISQTFDNVFHLNAIAFIHDTGNASPFDITLLTTPNGQRGFYPDAYHALVQLAQQFTGASIPVAINAFNVAVLATVWPLGILLLSRQIAGSSRAATIATGILAAALPAFPLNMLVYGVLYPFFLGLALMPAALALVMNLLGASREGRITTMWPHIVLLAGIIFGVAITHPGAMMGVLALATAVATAAFLNGWTQLNRKQKRQRSIGFGIFVAFGILLLIVLRQGNWWEPRMSVFEALQQLLTLSLEGYGLPLLTAALVLFGLVIAIRRKDVIGGAVIGMWIITAVLYVLAASAGPKILRFPTWVWYGDSPRLSAIFAIAVIPAGVLAVRWIVEALAKRSRPSWAGEVVVLLVIAAVTLTTAGYDRLARNIRWIHSISQDSRLLSEDEAALIKRLPDEVAADEVIAGNPWTGTSLAFAFADRQVIYPHMLMNDVGKDRETIMSSLKQADSNPAVCGAVDRLNVRYVLDFGTREVHKEAHRYPGIEGLSKSPLFELVDQEGDAKLYRFMGCQ